MAFVTLTKEQFEKEVLASNFRIIEDAKAKEVIYHVETTRDDVAVRIYSTVDIRTGQTRDKGTDAIRVVYWDLKNNRPIGKGKKILRVETKTTIQARIQARINEFITEVKDLEIIDFEYVKAILKFNNWAGFAVSLLDQVNERGNLSDKQLAYVLGEKNPRGKQTFEAMAIKKGFKYEPEMEDENEQDSRTGTEKAARTEKAEGLGKSEPETSYQRPEEKKEVKLIPTSNFKEWEYPFEFFNPVQSQVFPLADTDNNMIIGANTSAGKTIAAELLMDKVLDKDKRVIYLSPLKALTQEKYDDWQVRFPNDEILIMTGDYTLTNKRKKELQAASIIVMTSEMMDSRSRKFKSEKNWWMKEVGLVIVDESHILSTERGHAVESGIMRFTYLNPDARILFLSATMPNVNELGAWLTALNNKKTDVVYSTWRPVELQKHFEPYPILTYSSGRQDYWAIQNAKRDIAVEVVLSKPDEKFLVFVHDKGTGRDIVKRLAKEGVEAEFHNADLKPQERLDIEKSFEIKGFGLRVIVSTSTLAWGRNLPARNVVIVGIHRGMTEVDQLDIIQMAGRAGRYGIDDEGHVFLIIPSGSENYWNDVFQNPRPVKSVLNDHNILAFHALAEIETGGIKTEQDLFAWYSRSLAARQKMAFLPEEANALLADLEKMEMVLMNEAGHFKITGLGRVSAWMYFSPYDIYAWYSNFNRFWGKDRERPVELTDATLAWALGDAPCFDAYVSKDLQDEASKWSWRLNSYGILITDKTVLSTLATYKCLKDEKEKGLLGALVRGKKYDIKRISQALSMIDGFHADWKQEDVWQTLPMRIQYGIPAEMIGLVKIAGVGGVRAKKLWEIGMRDAKDVADPLNKPKLNKILPVNTMRKIVKSACEIAQG